MAETEIAAQRQREQLTCKRPRDCPWRQTYPASEWRRRPSRPARGETATSGETKKSRKRAPLYLPLYPPIPPKYPAHLTSVMIPPTPLLLVSNHASPFLSDGSFPTAVDTGPPPLRSSPLRKVSPSLSSRNREHDAWRANRSSDVGTNERTSDDRTSGGIMRRRADVAGAPRGPPGPAQTRASPEGSPGDLGSGDGGGEGWPLGSVVLKRLAAGSFRSVPSNRRSRSRRSSSRRRAASSSHAPRSVGGDRPERRGAVAAPAAAPARGYLTAPPGRAGEAAAMVGVSTPPGFFRGGQERRRGENSFFPPSSPPPPTDFGLAIFRTGELVLLLLLPTSSSSFSSSLLLFLPRSVSRVGRDLAPSHRRRLARAAIIFRSGGGEGVRWERKGDRSGLGLRLCEYSGWFLG